MAYRAEAVSAGDTTVFPRLAPACPLARLVGEGGKGPQQRLPLFGKSPPARALAFGEGPAVALLGLFGGRASKRADVGEDDAARRRRRPGRRPPGSVFDAGSVTRPLRSRGHCRCAVVGGHLPICAVWRGLALLGAGRDRDLRVVRRDAGRGAPKMLEGAHMAARPGALSHVRRRLGVGHAAEGQAGLRRLARSRADGPRRRPAPAGLHDAPRLAPRPARRLPARRESPVAPAEPAIGRRRPASLGAGVPVFGVQAPEGRAAAGGLLAGALPAGVGTGRPVVGALGGQKGMRLGVARPLGVPPGSPLLASCVKRARRARL